MREYTDMEKNHQVKWIDTMDENWHYSSILTESEAIELFNHLIDRFNESVKLVEIFRV